jgi:hypothetical protein
MSIRMTVESGFWYKIHDAMERRRNAKYYILERGRNIKKRKENSGPEKYRVQNYGHVQFELQGI